MSNKKNQSEMYGSALFGQNRPNIKKMGLMEGFMLGLNITKETICIQWVVGYIAATSRSHLLFNAKF